MMDIRATLSSGALLLKCVRTMATSSLEPLLTFRDTLPISIAVALPPGTGEDHLRPVL